MKLGFCLRELFFERGQKSGFLREACDPGEGLAAVLWVRDEHVVVTCRSIVSGAAQGVGGSLGVNLDGNMPILLPWRQFFSLKTSKSMGLRDRKYPHVRSYLTEYTSCTPQSRVTDRVLRGGKSELPLWERTAFLLSPHSHSQHYLMNHCL